MDLLNALVLLVNSILIPALTYGSTLALGALGVTLVFSILRFANFAHGDLMALGTVIALMLVNALRGLGVNLSPLPLGLVVLPLAVVAAALIAVAFDRSVFAYYRSIKARPIIMVMASIGVMFLLNGIVRLLYGAGDRSFFAPADGDPKIQLIRPREFKAWTGLEEGIALSLPQVLATLLAVVLMLSLFIFLQRTRLGKAMRAFADNEDLARLSGINPERVVVVTWVIAGGLAAVAGVLFGMDKVYKPFTYFQMLLPIFAATIVGGIGDPRGAVLGGYLVALSEISLTYVYRKVLTYLTPESWDFGLAQLLGTEYKFAISFLVLVVVLLVRPTGIFRGKVLS